MDAHEITEIGSQQSGRAHACRRCGPRPFRIRLPVGKSDPLSDSELCAHLDGGFCFPDPHPHGWVGPQDSSSGVRTVDDPAVGNSAQQFYRTLDGCRFHRSEILNHRVDAEGILRHGDVMEGLVLAQCFSSVPARCNQWKSMPLIVSIVNQFDDVYSFPFELPVEHVSLQPRPRRSGSLFGPAGRPADGSVPPATDQHVRLMAIASRR